MPLRFISSRKLLIGKASTAQATEGGLSPWPLGIENYGMGVVPPAGVSMPCGAMTNQAAFIDAPWVRTIGCWYPQHTLGTSPSPRSSR